jgi:hypothetical protein
MDQIKSLRKVLSVDVARARAELSKHVTAIRMTPSGEGREAHYVAEGEWDLLGVGQANTGLVAGAGFEPATFGL